MPSWLFFFILSRRLWSCQSCPLLARSHSLSLQRDDLSRCERSASLSVCLFIYLYDCRAILWPCVTSGNTGESKFIAANILVAIKCKLMAIEERLRLHQYDTCVCVCVAISIVGVLTIKLFKEPPKYYDFCCITQRLSITLNSVLIKTTAKAAAYHLPVGLKRENGCL